VAHKLIRQLLTCGGILGLVAVATPQAALGAAAHKVQRTITINITDSGFEQQSYTVGFTPGTSSNGADSGQVTFVNNGTAVHSARVIPGTPDAGASFGQRTDALGGVVACPMGRACGKMGATNTGGIDAGGAVSLGFAPINAGVTYALTSANDCLFGNQTSGFDCTPVELKVVSIPASGSLSGTFPGSVLRPNDSAECLPTVPAVVPSDGPAFCFSAVRDPGSVNGSPKAPLGDTRIEITDFGYSPTLVYVKAGSTVTWVNTGERVHTVQKKGPQAPPDGYHNLTSNGLDTGESYSYTFTKGSSTNYQSNTALDFVPSSISGFSVAAGCLNNASVIQRKGKFCGQPAMVGRVAVVG
jgi:hypothetical protein